MALPSRAYPGLALGPSTKYIPGPGTHVYGANVVASLAGTLELTQPRPQPSSKTAAATAAAAASTQSSQQQQLPTLSVISQRSSTSSSAAGGNPSTHVPLSRSVTRTCALPTVNSIVLGTVTRVSKDRVTVSISAVDGVVVGFGSNNSGVAPSGAGAGAGAGGGGDSNNNPMTGVIRREDVRGWEVDKVVPGDLFRVGDVVRAAVVSVGDSASYYLGTARNELGVLMARAADDDGDDGSYMAADDDDGRDGAGNGGRGGGRWMVPVSWKEFRDPVTGKREGRKVAKPV